VHFSFVIQLCDLTHTCIRQVLLHFRLKHDIMVAQKKTKDVQFFLEYMADDDILVGPGQKRRAAGDGDEIEEEQRQSALREKIERAFLEFAKKIDAVLPTGADGKKIFEFQVAFEEMQFVGSPKNQAVDIVPTADCLVRYCVLFSCVFKNPVFISKNRCICILESPSFSWSSKTLRLSFLSE
jgi:nucleosome binding factor SPN SPT16 subunit